MNIEEIHAYALSKPNAEVTFPFGDNTLVFKVKGKIFLLAGLDNIPVQFNVKCNPEEAIALREQFIESVLPGYHMNKKHWNTIVVNGHLSTKQLHQFIDNSYNLVSR